MNAEQIASLEAALHRFLGQFRRFFRRERTFEYWGQYVLGLLSDLNRKSIEPIALAAGIAVRTLQELLSQFVWDHDRIEEAMLRKVAEDHPGRHAFGVLDSSGHPKQGPKTPGVRRQWCGQLGKVDNCVIGQHLLYSDGHRRNPFCCLLASDLYLPKVWHQDRSRCEEAGIPEALVYRPRWKIALEQVARAMGNGVRLRWLLFDEEYGRVPQFWFGLDGLGIEGVGEVPSDFHCWTRLPRYQSLRAEHASRRVDRLVRHSPVFVNQPWRQLRVRDRTRGTEIWRYKAAQVYLVAEAHDHRRQPSVPTDRTYWLIVAENVRSGKRKYLVSNAAAAASAGRLLRIYLERWRVEEWFRRAKQETGFGSFEVRTYVSLIRHWLSSRMAMLFLAEQTQRLRGEKPGDHAGAGGGGGPLSVAEAVAAVVGLHAAIDPAACLSSVA